MDPLLNIWPMRKRDDIVYDCEFYFEKTMSGRLSKKRWMLKNNFVVQTPIVEPDRRSSLRKRKQKRKRKKDVSRTDRKIEAALVCTYFETDISSSAKKSVFCTRACEELVRDNVLSRLIGLEVLSLSLVNSILRSFAPEYFYDVIVPDLLDLFRRENNALRDKIRKINPEWTGSDLYRHPDYIDTKNVTMNGKLGDSFVSYNLISNKKIISSRDGKKGEKNFFFVAKKDDAPLVFKY